MEKAAVHLSRWFDDHGAILSKRVQPIWTDPDNDKIVSADKVEYADMQGTIDDHPTLMTKDRYYALVDAWAATDRGHSGNVREMKVAVKVAADSCIL